MIFYTHELTACGATAPLRCYIPDVSDPQRSYYADKRPAVIIFPGGAYAATYPGEAEPIALRFAADGICAFVLDYSCAPHRFPIPQLQAFAAVRYVRENAEKYGIQVDNIATCGFSAGGHLCSCTGTLWNKEAFLPYLEAEGMLDCDRRMYRPDKLILCYAATLSKGPFHIPFMYDNILGDRPHDPALCELLGTADQIDAETPCAFIWHTAEDDCVPVRNSLDFACGLAGLGILAEVHIYKHGGHGLCLGNHVTEHRPFTDPHEVAEWIDHAIRFAYDT